ncbi:AMP-binding protein [Roseibium sp.]|uniref:AMP-binding protein n=1 Tax=Roseibium sp. TaxID=1936156 RepID=UPI003BB209D9
MAFVGDRLDQFATDFPERAALTCGPKRLSRRDLVRALDSLERALLPRTGDTGRVVLRLRDPVALLLGFFACARTGRIAVVMDPDWPDAQAGSTLAAVSPDLVVTDRTYSELVASSPDVGTLVRPGAENLFYAGFTSGSSGQPKAYVRSHGSWLDSFELSSTSFGIAPDSRVVIPGQLTHSLHLYGAVCGLAGGQEVAIVPRFDPRSVLGALSGSKTGAVLYATPTQLHLIAEAARHSGPVENVRQVLASGAKWHDADRKALRAVFPEAQLFEFYGASETSFITISGPEDRMPEGSVGRAAKGVDILIGEPRNPAPTGQAGPVWVRSSLLFHGYLTGASQVTRWQDGWLTVGDHGRLDADGFLFLTGRENRMIVTSGLNVYPEEVETVLASHPNVLEAVVIGLADPVRGERLEAVVKMTAATEETAMELTRFCRDRLAPGKVPRAFHVKETLPMTAGGKPDIQQLVADLTSPGARV